MSKRSSAPDGRRHRKHPSAAGKWRRPVGDAQRFQARLQFGEATPAAASLGRGRPFTSAMNTGTPIAESALPAPAG